MKLEDFLDKPIITKKEKEIVLNLESKAESNIIEMEEEVDADDKKFDEFLALVDKAIDATSGLKKIIEQTQSKESVPATLKEQRIMENLLNVKSDIITFEIYQQAIALRDKLVFDQMRKGMMNEQFS